MTQDVTRRAWLRGAVAAAVAPLVACGGEGVVALIPGVGTGGTGAVLGVLTGLGSLVVDGQRYDESGASLVTEPALDASAAQALALADFQVGHTVEMSLDAQGQVSRVVLQPQWVAVLERVEADTLWLWGQAVRVQRDPSQGRTTVLSGLVWADLPKLTGHGLRVYAEWVGFGNAGTWWATRVEYLGEAPALLARVSGVLQWSSTQPEVAQIGGCRCLLSGLAGAENAPLWAGQHVSVVGPWVALGRLSQAWQPLAWRLSRPALSASRTTEVGGRVAWDPAQPQQINLRGVPIRVPVGLARTWNDGDSVRATLALAEDGVWEARRVEAVAAQVRLSGLIGSWVDRDSFVVRGMSAALAPQAVVLGGAVTDLKNGSYVQATGVLQTDKVLLDRVEILSDLPDRAVLMLQGDVVSVQGRQVGLRTANRQEWSVAWDVTIAPLPGVGERLELQGHWNQTRQDCSLQTAQALPGLASDAEPVSGVIDAVDTEQGRVLLNGRWVEVDPGDFSDLQTRQGQRVNLGVVREGVALKLKRPGPRPG